MTTLKQQTSKPIKDKSIYLREDSLVNHSQMLALREERTIPDTFGRKCSEQLEKFAPDGSLRRMFVGLLVGMPGWYSTRCVLTWKMRATKSSRVYCQLAVSTLRIKDTESGLLPTVQTKGLKVCNKQGRTEFMKLELLPTPTASESTGGGQIVSGLRKKRPSGQIYPSKIIDLFVSGLLPTPQATDYKRGTKSEHQQSVGRTLGLKASRLNPQFLAEMMGFPPNWTVFPFQNGEHNP